MRDIIQHRRNLHEIPELNFDLQNTKMYLISVLSKLDCSIYEITQSSFVCFFDFGKKNSIAFRTDMDALPLVEKTGLSFSSKIKGNMHACGHDGHMAIMLGFAKEIDKKKQEGTRKYSNNIVLVFQEGEEGDGGAENIVKSKILKKLSVAKIYGLHLWPLFKKNEIICGETLMAGTVPFKIIIVGKASHISEPEKGKDSLFSGAKFLINLYEKIDTLPKYDFRIFKINKFDSGTADNIISSRTEMKGAIRFFDIVVKEKIQKIVVDTAKKTEKEFGVNIEVDFKKGYAPIKNDPLLLKTLKEASKNLNLNYKNIRKPVLAAEDFSFYSLASPSLFFFLATGLKKNLHSNDYDIAEDVLETGVKIFMELTHNQI